MIKFPSFHRFPFAFLSCFLMLGIILNFFYASKELSILFPILAISTAIIFIILRKHLQRYFIIFTSISFICLGYIALENYNYIHFEEKKSDGVLILRVDEYQKKEGWSKGVAQICHLEDNKLKASKKRVVFYAETKQAINKYDVLQVATTLFPIENKNIYPINL